MFGDRRPYLTALVTLDEAAMGLSDPEPDPGGRRRGESDKASFEQVKRFAILDRDFSAEHDEVTPTLKLKRKVVCQHFADEIEGLYAQPR